MASIIPFPNNLPSFTQSMVLEGVSYVFNFKWNTRGEFWTFNINDDQTDPLIEGIQIVLNFEMLGQYQYKAIPQGKLYALDTSGSVEPIAYEDMFNGRITLLYLDEGEEL